jgi:hypothetical protein
MNFTKQSLSKGKLSLAAAMDLPPCGYIRGQIYPEYKTPQSAPGGENYGGIPHCSFEQSVLVKFRTEHISLDSPC